MSDEPTGSGSAGQDGACDVRGPAARIKAADFAASAIADGMAAGPELAAGVEDVWQQGLAALSDDELIGVLRAARRLASRAAALEWSAVADLVTRRQAAGEVRGGPRPGELADAEVAAALTLTRFAAAHLQDVALGVARLPGVMKALTAGRIDPPKASVIAAETTGLSDVAAGAVGAAVIRDAPGQTTGQLRAACRQAVLIADPSAAWRRKVAAVKQARVELWHEPIWDGRAGRPRSAGPAGARRGPAPGRRRALAEEPRGGRLGEPVTRSGFRHPAGRPVPALPAPGRHRARQCCSRTSRQPRTCLLLPCTSRQPRTCRGRPAGSRLLRLPGAGPAREREARSRQDSRPRRPAPPEAQDQHWPDR